jgi:3-oxoacyl-(acyl-carrier-protein) synthase
VVEKDRIGILVGSAIGGIATIVDQQRTLMERGGDRLSPFFIPSTLVDTASGQIAIPRITGRTRARLRMRDRLHRRRRRAKR